MENKQILEKLDNFLSKPTLNDNQKDNVKKLKTDRGLIERVNSSKLVLTEDNKQLLLEG
jgi:hypothetical protein